jgi:hypothetical protein
MNIADASMFVTGEQKVPIVDMLFRDHTIAHLLKGFDASLKIRCGEGGRSRRYDGNGVAGVKALWLQNGH